MSPSRASDPAPGGADGGAVAYFVSPHGFGHAARASAVMAALTRRRPGVRLHVFTTVPRWFFDDSLGLPLTYHPLQTDVGFVQRDPFVEDLPATLARLGEFWRGLEETAADLATTLRRLGVGLVVADISPLGLAAAVSAGLPGILVENFTWDWIYRGYLDEEPRLAEFARLNEEALARASARIQTTPICEPVEHALEVPPVSREPRTGRREIRRALGLEATDPRPVVLLTMGGMGWLRQRRPTTSEAVLLVTLGGTDSTLRRPGLVALPDRSPIFPPDLTAAADLVVGKLGYSTVAECYRAGARLAFLERPRFPESEVLAEFCRDRLGAVSIDPAAFDDGEWLADLPRLLAMPRPQPGRATGAEEIARFLDERSQR